MGRRIARVGDYFFAYGYWFCKAYSWGDWFIDDLEKLAAQSPGKPVHLVCPLSGIAFAGLVPNDWTPSSHAEAGPDDIHS